MSSNPPWMEDDRPPWEIADVDGDPGDEGASRMRSLMRSPSTGFAGATNPKSLIPVLEKGQPGPEDPEFYGGGDEGAMRAGEFRGQKEGGLIGAGMIGSALPLAFPGRTAGAAFGGYEGYRRRGSKLDALEGAAVGAFAPEIVGRLGGPLLRFALGTRGAALASSAMRAIGKEAKAAPIVTAAEKAAEKAAKKAATWEAGQRTAAEAQDVKDVLKVEEQWKRAQEAARKTEATKRALAEASEAKSGMKAEEGWQRAQEIARKAEAKKLAAAEAEAAKSGIKTEQQWLKAQEAAGKVGKPPDIPLSEAKQRAAAEAEAIRDQIKVEQQWLASQGKAPVASAASPATRAMTEQEETVKALMSGKVFGHKMSREQAEGIIRNMGGTPTHSVPSALAGPRVRIGAERVGRGAGMTKEAVRREAGPVLDEALGEASPILPKKILSDIIDTMKPMSMAEREAYVARATSGKTKAQVENIRRTLEHLGLLLPVGAVAYQETR